MMTKKILVLSALLTLALCTAHAQTSQGDLKKITSAIDSFRSRYTPEKLYLQLDKPYYTLGDTMWIKAYLLDGSLLTPSEKTGIIYLELANDTNAVLLRRMMPAASGLGAGNIAIPAKDFPEGSYTLKAYSNLMRNYGESLVFKRPLYISSATSQAWLVRSKATLSKSSDGQNVAMQLQLNTPDKKHVGLRDLQVKIMNGKRTLKSDRQRTNSSGELSIDFDLNEATKSGQLFLTLSEDEKKNTQPLRIPLMISRPENIDLQFMPEGGYLVGDVVSKIGFKAIGEDGKGVDISGKIYAEDSTQPLADFRSLYKGMGSFFLVPKAGKKYIAKVVLPDGTLRSYPLPEVKISGTSLSIRNPQNSDSLQVIVSIPAGQAGSYYLLGQSGLAVAFAAPVRSSARIFVSKKLFLTGTVRFTLFNNSRIPQNERLTYVDHKDHLNIKLTPSKTSYTTRDSVSVELEVSNESGKPVSGNFSLAVTDDNQIKTDLNAADIRSTMLLSADLNGEVEGPRFYFSQDSTGEALDNLLLTQGWVLYSGNDTKEKTVSANAALWQTIMQPEPENLFPPEATFTVNGRVTNILKKGIAGTPVLMLATKPNYFKQLKTDSEGRFSFSEFPEKDSLVLKFQATNKKGNLTAMNITIDKFQPPVFSAISKQVTPWFMNSEATMLNYMKVSEEQKKDYLLPGGKDMLQEVTITAKKIIQASHNKNGPGNADIILDEEEMKKAENKTLAQLLANRFSGFRKTKVPLSDTIVYMLGERIIRFSIDGYPDEESSIPGIPRMVNFLIDDYMDYITTDDVLGIEIMTSMSYGTTYDQEFGKKLLGARDAGPPEVWFEITTRSGNGAFAKTTMGTSLYRPMPFVGSKQFYTPKYTSGATTTFKDLRSTIHWQPEVITDAQGKARVSFFSADTAGTYTIIIEGSDMSGHVGSGSEKVVIK